MDGQRFDELARRFATARSRRSVLKALLGGFAGGIAGASLRGPQGVALADDDDDDDDGGRGCKREGKRCSKPGQCCAGLACRRRKCTPGCQIGRAFVAPGTPNPANQCQVCDPALSTMDWTNVAANTPCVDPSDCTTGDVCDGFGACSGLLQPPTISCPGDVPAATSDACGAVALFEVTTGCADTVVCDRVSGESFPVGSTTVTCTATNAAGSTPCSFAVTVVDDDAPGLNCPASVDVAGSGPTNVSFAVTAVDNCAPVTVTCNPAPGSAFPLGTTTVTCTATDPNGLQNACSFPVTVSCTPSCDGKPCGAGDGCGGICQQGTCRAAGPCEESVTCQAGQCVASFKPSGVFCERTCFQRATCNGSGVCQGGTEVQCPEGSDPCRDRFGTCSVEQGRCVYPQKPAGAVCSGSSTNLCDVNRCQADGSCASAPVDCDDECQQCLPTTGGCIDIKENEVCGNGARICRSGRCVSPCGEDCPDERCYRQFDSGGQFQRNFCCEAEAMADDGCCWRRDAYGVVLDGVCYDPEQVCDGDVGCGADCCEYQGSQGTVRTCCADGEYCTAVGCRAVTGTCTTDAECGGQQYGAAAVCAYLEYTFDIQTGPKAVPGSGTCCPQGAIEGPPDLLFGNAPVYSCCGPGTTYVQVSQSVGECCGFPDKDCQGCQCSFGRIGRCCG